MVFLVLVDKKVVEKFRLQFTTFSSKNLMVKEISVNQEINVLALVKGQERYVFIYSDENRSETMRLLGRYASNPDLSFSWYDAAVLSQKIRRERQREALSSNRQGKFSITDHQSNH